MTNLSDETFNSFAREFLAGLSAVTSGIQETNVKLDQTNARLDQTNARLDQTNVKLDRFERSIAKKMDGIGSYLKSMDRTFLGHEIRISDLERRMSDIEKTG